MLVPILASVGFYLLGAVFLTLGFYLRRRAERFLATSVEVLGTVVCMEQRRDIFQPESGPTFVPLVTYKDDQGRLYTLRRSWGEAPPPCEVGVRWPVYYQAANPHVAKLGPRLEIFRASQNCFVLGVFLLIFGTGILLLPLLRTA